MFKEKYLPKVHWFIRLVFLASILGISWIVVGYIIPKILPKADISNTAKSGIIIRHEKWSGEIKIVGDIWALPGAVVEIAPGTKVLIKDNNDKSNLHWWLPDLWSGLNTKEERFGVKNGELFKDERQKISLHFARFFARGTKEQPILIKSDVSQPSPYDFNTISVDAGVISHATLSDYRRFEIGDEVTVRDSRFSNIVECAICVNFASPSIINNIFEGVIRQYIWIKGGSPKITDNLFMVSKGEGIVIDPRQIGAPIIYHNNFEMPERVAVEFLGGGEDLGGVLSFNDFSGGSVIKIPCDSKVEIAQNLIRGVVKLAHSGNCVGKMILGANNWQSLDKQAILREKIVDKEPQFEVSIPFILGSSPSGVGRRL